MPGRDPQLQSGPHDQPRTRRLRLVALELEGFKSFRDRTVAPLDDFTCVVGPNGTGKSVVGEAIAFALGGNRKMLRAGSLAALLNQELAAAGQRTAEVVLHMELQQQSQGAEDATAPRHALTSPSLAQSPSVTNAAPPSMHTSPAALTSSTYEAAVSHQSQQCDKPTALQQQQQAAATVPGPPPRQQMKLKRVLRGDSTKSYIMRPGTSSWAAVRQAQLQAELAPYGIDTQVVDRYIVTQSRQAVDVSDAVGLVKQLEGLTGAVDYEEAIARHSGGLEHLAAGMEEAKTEIDRLEHQRELLAPAVAHWREVQQLQAQVSATKLQLLTEQQEHGSRLLEVQAQQVKAAEECVAGAAQVLDSATAKESGLLQQRAALDKELLAAKRLEEQLVKKVSKLSAAAAAAGVQHSSAASALKDNTSLMRALQKKRAQHDQQEASHKAQVEEGTEQLRVLQEAAAAAQEQLAAARTAAGAAAKPKPGAEHALSAAARELQQQQQTLQQQLFDLSSEGQLLTARQAAAAAKATRAAKAVAALQQKAEVAAAAAAQERSALGEAGEAVQMAAAAVAASRDSSTAAEEQWRAAELQQQVLADRLEEVQQQNPHQQQHNPHSSTPGALPSYDAAVQHLAAASSSGRLPGQFYGRLCNLVAVTQPSVQCAVNAALRERCNLASLLVVSERTTAAAVIDHFRQHRVGTVNCRILSELQQQRGPGPNTQPQPAAAAARGVSCVPLLTLVQYDSAAVPGLQQLMEQLLGGWLLMDTREAALQLLHLKRSIVTRSGEVFKADGEIVASFGGPGDGGSTGAATSSTLPAYSLATGQPIPIPAATASTDSTGVQSAEAAASIAAADGEKRRLKQQRAAAQQQARTAQQAFQSARMAVLQQEQQHAAAEARLQQLQQQQQRRRGMGSRAGAASTEQLLQEALHKQAAAAQELPAAEAAVTALQQQEEQLRQQLAAVTSAVAAGSDTAATAAAGRLQQAEQVAAQAAAAVEAAWQAVHKAEQQQKRAAGRAAAINKELAKVQAALRAAGVGELQAKVNRLQQQLCDTQSALQQARTDAASISSRAKPVKQQLAKAVAAKEKAAAALEGAQGELQQAQASLMELQQQQQHRAQALEQLQPKRAPVAAAAVAGAAEEAAADDGGKRARTGGQRSSSSQGDGDCSSLPGHEQQGGADEGLLDADVAAADTTTAGAAGDVEMASPSPAGHSGSLGGMQMVSREASTGQRRSRRRCADAAPGGRQAGGLRRRTRAAVIADSSSSSGADDELSSRDSSSSEDDGFERGGGGPRTRGRRAAGAGAAAAGGRKLRGRRGADSKPTGGKRTDAEAGSAPAVSAAALAKQTSLLQQRQQQLEQQELELQQEYARVDRAALQQDLTALQGLAAAHSTLQRLQQQHEAAATALEQLLDERYSRLLSVLQRLNASLDAVYGALTGGCGKAYCSYTAERRLLFSQGVVLHVQPDGSTWRRMGMLSGGQRSLATLALSFALQTLFPSPFYFFDEVDCALDTSAAARVAAYVRQQCGGAAGAQYLLVSHKPVVFESAGCLLGVYSNGRGSSAAVVGRFEQQQAAGA